jgi:hypothetical protein
MLSQQPVTEKLIRREKVKQNVKRMFVPFNDSNSDNGGK